MNTTEAFKKHFEKTENDFKNIDKRFSQPLTPLRNAYSYYNSDKTYETRSDPDPPFSTFTPSFKGLIDHILFNDRFKLKLLLEVPKLSEIETGLPNEVYASDHVRLEAVFLFRSFPEDFEKEPSWDE
jgi:mRNA deadenylase 3'-5' endonuclease subunit Ccr4